MGKSLLVSQKGDKLQTLTRQSKPFRDRNSKSIAPETFVVTTSLHGTNVEVKEVVNSLCHFEEKLEAVFPRIYHFDVAPTVYVFIKK